MNASILQNLEVVARNLGRLGLDDVVFVGGATIGLYLTDPAAPEVRPTQDVDVVVPTESRSYYHELEEKLRNAGYQQPIGDDQPICRWVIEGVAVDVMPMDEGVLGFSNRWYRGVVEHAVETELPGGAEVRVATAPFAVASKLEAFKGRGGGDYRFSHDLEDVIVLIDGRAELISEIANAPSDVRLFIAKEFESLLSNSEFVDSIPGYLDADEASQGRVPLVRARMQKIRDL